MASQASNLLGQGGRDATQPTQNPDVHLPRLHELWLGLTVRFPRLGKLASRFTSSEDQPASDDQQLTDGGGDRGMLFQGDYTGIFLITVLGGIMVYAVSKN